MTVVVFRLAYLGVTNAPALLRLLPMSDRDKDAEILVLRHQITVLERQLHGERIRFSAADRALLSALLHRLRLLVRPETVLRWHRDLIRRRYAAISGPKRTGRISILDAFKPYLDERWNTDGRVSPGLSGSLPVVHDRK